MDARTLSGHRVRVVSVLVADGQRLFAEALALALATFPDLEIVDVQPTSGADAVSAVTSHAPDVAVVSHAMEEIQGGALVRALLARRADLKVIVLAWLYGQQQAADVLMAGAVGCLPKNVGIDQLVEGIHRAVGGERPIFAEEMQRTLGLIAQRADHHSAMSERFASLTPRELEVLRLIAGGLAAVEIADRLGITERTVRTHIDNVLNKTDTHSQIELLALARDQGLVS